jgi:hypothetical protein
MHSINTGAISFTTKVVENMIFVERENARRYENGILSWCQVLGRARMGTEKLTYGYF